MVAAGPGPRVSEQRQTFLQQTPGLILPDLGLSHPRNEWESPFAPLQPVTSGWEPRPGGLEGGPGFRIQQIPQAVDLPGCQDPPLELAMATSSQPACGVPISVTTPAQGAPQGLAQALSPRLPKRGPDDLPARPL